MRNDDPGPAAQFELTKGEWEAVMGENPSCHSECGWRCSIEIVSCEDVQ